ncbi:MAG: hypothetical protein GY750_08830 [Lentisphaerae bacterium]|nr:hypothetical protein [Lentisphaerota bacterium]MCP4101515.1 hypothetical protein [Lentisphaerota bacterium]
MPRWPRRGLWYDKCPICEKFGATEVCRNCGRVVCANCCTQKRPYIKVLAGTPPDKQYNSRHSYVPVCDVCVKIPEVLYNEDDFSRTPLNVQQLAAFAKQIIIKANASFPVSSSRMGYYKDFNPNLCFTQSRQQEVFETTHAILREPEKYIDGLQQGGDSFEKLEKMILHSLKYSIANCFELAGFSYLMYHYAICRGEFRVHNVEVCHLPGRDHVFLIVTPWHESIPQNEFYSNDQTLKYSNAFICDPWLKFLFFLRNYREYIGKHKIAREPIRFSYFKFYYKTGCPEIERYL